jgi:hypothetical protein
MPAEISELAPDSRAEARRLWPAALGVALLGAGICFAALPGLNWPLWTLAAIAGLIVTLPRRSERTQRVALDRTSGLFLTLAAALSCGAAVTAEPTLQGLILIAVAALGAYVLKRSGSLVPGAVLLAPFRIGLAALAEAGRRASEAAALLRADSVVPILRGTALALPILVVLSLLLSGADPTLANWRDALAEALRQLTFLPRLIFFLVLATGLTGSYGIAVRGAELGVAPGSPSAPRLLSQVERLIVLASVAALFALFFLLQLSYLFGSIGAQPGSGVTFAEATHRGFGELTVAAALCVALILGLESCAARAGREPWIRMLSGLIILEALLLLVSAYQRVVAYEAAYGFTVQRLYVQIYAGAVGVILVLLAVELLAGVDPARFARRTIVTVLLGLGLVTFWNPSAWVVRANVARHQVIRRIDAEYLAQLAGRSPDAIAELVRALPELEPADAARLRAALEASAARHAGFFREPAWYEWNLHRAEARSALASAGLLPQQAH